MRQLLGLQDQTENDDDNHDRGSLDGCRPRWSIVWEYRFPASQVAQTATEKEVLVMELSSFQLMGIEAFRPKVACIVNIFSAHLDYHGSREEYVKAKLQITKNQTEEDFLVYNADFPELYEFIKGHTKATLVPFSRKSVLEHGTYSDETTIYFNGEAVMHLKRFKCRAFKTLRTCWRRLPLVNYKVQQMKESKKRFVHSME